MMVGLWNHHSFILQADAEPLEASFELNDTLYAKANIHETEEVYLWLGVSAAQPATDRH